MTHWRLPVGRHPRRAAPARIGCARRVGTQMEFGWKLYGDGKTPQMGEEVALDEKLFWPSMVG